MTLRYLHTDDDRLRAAVEAVAGKVKGAGWAGLMAEERRLALLRAKARNLLRRTGRPPGQRGRTTDRAPNDIEIFSRAVMALAFAAIAGALVFAVLFAIGFPSSGPRVLITLGAAGFGYWLGLNRHGWDD